MTIAVTPFLRNVLNADAAMGGGAAFMMLAGAPSLSPWLGLPPALLAGAGLALLPIVAILFWMARQPQISRRLLLDIVLINAAWVAASIGLLMTDYVAPTMLGIAFVAAQAIAVAVLAELEYVALRRASAAA